MQSLLHQQEMRRRGAVQAQRNWQAHQQWSQRQTNNAIYGFVGLIHDIEEYSRNNPRDPDSYGSSSTDEGYAGGFTERDW